MALILRYGEDASSANLIDGSPVVLGPDEIELSSSAGINSTAPNAGSAIIINSFVGKVIGVDTEIGGVYKYIIKYDPEVYKVPLVDGYTARFYGTGSESVGGIGRVSRTVELGKYGQQNKTYNKTLSFNLECSMYRKYAIHGVLDVLIRPDLFIENDCGTSSYIYFVGLKTKELKTITNKARISLSFTIGTNKRFTI